MRKVGLELIIATLVVTAPQAAAQVADSAMSLDSILNITVSSASRYDQTVQQAPASVSVITADDIERYAVETVGDALALLAGFYTSYDLNYTYVGVRGFGRPTDYNNRILLLVNGQSINEPEYGSAPFGTEFPLPVSLIERIEVVRGPGSVLYGTGAMTAVVNVITKSGREFGRAWGRLEYGSMNRRSAVASADHQFRNGATVQFSAHWSRNDGADRYFQEFDNGTRDGTARELDAEKYEGAYLSFSKLGFLLTAGVFERTKEVPTASWDAEFNHPDTWTMDRRAKIGMKYRYGVNARTEAFFGLRYEHFEYVGSYPSSESAFRDATTSIWARGEGGILWDISSGHRLIAGGEFTKVARSDYRTYYDGVEDSNFDVPFELRAVYAQLESRLTRRLRSVVGFSHDRRSGNITSTNPRIALIYEPSAATTVKLLYGRAFRAPNPYELHTDAAWAGTTQRAKLTPERIATTEIALDHDIGNHGLLSASVYHNAFNDLIEFVPVAGEPDGGNYMNYTGVRGTGVETTLRLREWRGQSGFVSASFQDTEDAITRTHLSNAPERMFKAGWNSEFGPSFVGGLFLFRESGRLTLANTKTSAYTRLDGTLATSALTGIKLTVAVRNIFDTEYAIPAGAEHKQSTIPQNRRTFVLRVDAHLK